MNRTTGLFRAARGPRALVDAALTGARAPHTPHSLFQRQERLLASKPLSKDEVRTAGAGPRLPGEYDVFGGDDHEIGDKVMIDGYSASRFSVNAILILGCGKRIKMIDPQLRDFFRSKGIAIEALDTWNAVATWNILNQEDRAVAAALMPFDYE